MWMKIFEKILLAGCLAISNTVAAPERAANLEPVPLPVPLVEEIILDQKELTCLQKNIYFEARNQGRPGMRAVAAVTINRTEDPRFPDTICGVVYQRKQFSWANRGDRQPYLRNVHEAKAWETAGEIARKAMIGTLSHDVGNAQYFHVISLGKPRSWPPMNITATVKDHVFYHQPL